MIGPRSYLTSYCIQYGVAVVCFLITYYWDQHANSKLALSFLGYYKVKQLPSAIGHKAMCTCIKLTGALNYKLLRTDTIGMKLGI